MIPRFGSDVLKGFVYKLKVNQGTFRDAIPEIKDNFHGIMPFAAFTSLNRTHTGQGN
jgi:hypothetical protein